MKFYSGVSLRGLRDQNGFSVYTFMGGAILAAVIIGALLYFPWKEVFKGKQDPDMAAAYSAMADKQWEKAVSFFDKAAKSNPGNAEAFIGRSRAYLHLGRLDKAFDDAKTALEKDPGSAAAYGQRGIVNKIQRNTDQALQDFSSAVKLNPRYAWAYAQRADIHSRNKDQDKALADVTLAIKSNPNFIDAYRLQAWVLNRMGRCREANEAFKKVEQLNSNDAWSIQDKAWFLLTCPDEKLQDSSKALELAKKALELSEGKDGVVHETLAEAYFRQGDPVKAVDHQRKAIELGSQRCPDGSCVKEMQQRLQKYEMAARQEVRTGYEILPLDSGQ
ncbi:MAG: tetratricopeptide repeat protein [Desulfomonile tiedjei]|nr:tetratricopeptide repeat protein [Desulfomonile tiedjei]